MNGLGKSMKIRHVMKLRHFGKKWRKLAGSRKVSLALVSKLLSSRSCRVPYVLEGQQVEGKKSASNIPPDVPSGHLAVYVGQKCSKRFVIRVAYLNHPVFRALLEQAEEQFGYAQQGGLAIPCDELLFEQILRLFTQNDLTAVRHLDLEAVKGNFCNEWHCPSEAKGISFGAESRSILHAFAEKSVR